MGRLVGFCTAIALLSAIGAPASAAALQNETDEADTDPGGGQPPDPTWVEDATSALVQESALLEAAGALPPDTTVAFIATWVATPATPRAQIGEQLTALEAANAELLTFAQSQPWDLSPEVQAALAPSPAALAQRLTAGETAFVDPRPWLDAVSDLLVRQGGVPAGARDRAEYSFIIEALQNFDAERVVDLEAFVGATPSPAQPAVQTAPVAEATLVRAGNNGGRFPTLAVAAGVGVLLLAMAVGLFRRSSRSKSRTDDGIDTLTQLRNRRRMHTDFSRLVTGEEIGFAMIDIDNFKAFNADQGQASGDILLTHIAATIAANVRIDDVVYRYGGGAFSVLLRNCAQTEAMEVVERVRSAVESLDIEGSATTVTVSSGIAIGDAADVLVLSEHAGAALYGAKNAGRNITMVHTD